jgi:predicted metal-binding membrane protein
VTREPADAAHAARGWEAALIGGLLGLSAVAWFATGRLGDSDMRMGPLTGSASMSSMPEMVAHSAGTMGLFLVTWFVMMVAMMFPAIVPVVITFDRWVRRAHRPRLATMTFVGGYLLVWTGFGLVVYASVVYFQPRLPMGDSAIRLGAALLLLAGVYQFTPLKWRCLRHCRSPLAFIAQHASELRRGSFGTARVGVIHGAFCLGCCWALMLVLVLLGMMSLSWMAAVAGVIFIEKVIPRGSLVPLGVAVILVGLGFVLLLSPHALPALG